MERKCTSISGRTHGKAGLERVALAFTMFVHIAGCGASVAIGSEGGISVDDVDQESPEAGSGQDAGAADIPVDQQPSRCPAVVEPRHPTNPCDNIGRIACNRWAQGLVDAGIASSVCVSAANPCARADRCDDRNDPSSCRCGEEPACGVGEVCVRPQEDAPPRCQCIDLR